MRNETGERSDAKDSIGCVGRLAVSVVQMAEMDATQKRVWEVRQGGKGGLRGAAVHTHTHTVVQWNDCNSLQVFHWPFTRVLTHCDSPRPLPALHSGPSQSTRCSQRSSPHTLKLSAAWTELGKQCCLYFPALSSLSVSMSGQWKEFYCYFYPRPVRLLVCWQGRCFFYNLYRKDKSSSVQLGSYSSHLEAARSNLLATKQLTGAVEGSGPLLKGTPLVVMGKGQELVFHFPRSNVSCWLGGEGSYHWPSSQI